MQLFCKKNPFFETPFYFTLFIYLHFPQVFLYPLHLGPSLASLGEQLFAYYLSNLMFFIRDS